VDHIKREPMALTIDGIQLEKFGLLIDKLDKFLYNLFLLYVLPYKLYTSTMKGCGYFHSLKLLTLNLGNFSHEDADAVLRRFLKLSAVDLNTN
jgi:hypothetical protein